VPLADMTYQDLATSNNLNMSRDIVPSPESSDVVLMQLVTDVPLRERLARLADALPLRRMREPDGEASDTKSEESDETSHATCSTCSPSVHS
jgi:hypothetical protein